MSNPYKANNIGWRCDNKTIHTQRPEYNPLRDNKLLNPFLKILLKDIIDSAEFAYGGQGSVAVRDIKSEFKKLGVE